MTLLFWLSLALFSVIFFRIAWKRIDKAAWILLVFLPTYLIRFQVGAIPMTLLEWMILMLSLSWLIQRLKNKELSLAKTRPYLPQALLLIFAATLGMFTAPELRAAAGIWKAYFIEPILFFIVLSNIIHTPQQRKNVITALALSLLAPGIFAIIQKFTGVFIPNEFWRAEETRRVTSFYGYPNAFGLYAAPILALIFGFLFTEKKKWNLVLFPPIILIGIASIIFAQSKGALLALFSALVFYIIFFKKLRYTALFTLAFLALILFIFFPFIFSIQGITTVSGGGSLEIRLTQWLETLEMLKTRPILGAGLSGYQKRVEPFHQFQHLEIFLYPHQLLLTFWSETGLLGLIAFLWILFVFFKLLKNAFKKYHDELALPLGGAMTALLVHGLVDVSYFKNDLSVLFWTLLALSTFTPKTPSSITIGIDVNPANKRQRTGVGWYTFHLVESLKIISLRASNHNISFRLYSSFPLKGRLSQLPPKWESRVLRWLALGRRNFWTQIRLSAEMLLNPPDIFFSPGYTLPFLHPKKSYVMIHDIAFMHRPEDYSPSEAKFLQWITRYTLKRAFAVLTPSEYTKKDLIETFQFPAEKIFPVPLAANKAFLSKNIDTSLKDKVKKLYRITSPYIIYIGRLQAKKNISGIIESFAQIHRKAPHFSSLKLVLVGPPNYGWEKAQQIIQKNHLSDAVLLLNYVDQKYLPALLSQAEALIFPSFYEGFGIPILEAQMCGVPVITSNTTSMPEVAGEGALLVDPLNTAEIAQALQEVLTNQEKRNQLIEKGYQNAKNYSWEKTAEITLAYLTKDTSLE